MSDVVDLAVALINTQSVSGSEQPMTSWLHNWFDREGFEVRRQHVADGRENIYAHLSKKPRLLFNSHIDTVPPFYPAHFEGARLYGRGACDTKSLIAAQLLAAKELRAKGMDDFGMLYVVGEEVDHCGMVKANELGLDPEFLIVGEPTESKLAQRQKGMLKLRLTAKGKMAHSGYPHLGVSAIAPMIDVLSDLHHADWPEEATLGQTTLNTGLIQGGRAANVVPDDCRAELLVRVVTDHQSVLRQVRRIVADRVHVEVIAGNDPTDLSVLPGWDTTIVAFNTDIPYFKFHGKAFLWGAGSILDAHTDREFIEIADLEKAVDVYATLAEQLLAS